MSHLKEVVYFWFIASPLIPPHYVKRQNDSTNPGRPLLGIFLMNQMLQICRHYVPTLTYLPITHPFPLIILNLSQHPCSPSHDIFASFPTMVWSCFPPIILRSTLEFSHKFFRNPYIKRENRQTNTSRHDPTTLVEVIHESVTHFHTSSLPLFPNKCSSSNPP